MFPIPFSVFRYNYIFLFFSSLPCSSINPPFPNTPPIRRARISLRLIINYHYWLDCMVLLFLWYRRSWGWRGLVAARCVSRAAAPSPPSRGRLGGKAGRRRSASQHSFARPLTPAVLSESSSRLPSIVWILDPTLLVQLPRPEEREER